MLSPGTLAFRQHISRRFPPRFLFIEGRMEQRSEWLARLSRELKLKSPSRASDLFYDADTIIDRDAGEDVLFFGSKPATGEITAAEFHQNINETSRLYGELAELRRRLDERENFERKLRRVLG
jgi:hypothetical protein